jgi:hypothetical protein
MAAKTGYQGGDLTLALPEWSLCLTKADFRPTKPAPFSEKPGLEGETGGQLMGGGGLNCPRFFLAPAILTALNAHGNRQFDHVRILAIRHRLPRRARPPREPRRGSVCVLTNIRQMCYECEVGGFWPMSGAKELSHGTHQGLAGPAGCSVR